MAIPTATAANSLHQTHTLTRGHLPPEHSEYDYTVSGTSCRRIPVARTRTNGMHLACNCTTQGHRDSPKLELNLVFCTKCSQWGLEEGGESGGEGGHLPALTPTKHPPQVPPQATHTTKEPHSRRTGDTHLAEELFRTWFCRILGWWQR